ncbi:MAG TPA: TetR/AcrR family transcriptional regulator [Solirubrobacteraceae bacterium]|nr:TetR/AcrR family transcriptional regulator [Solirubrobacteraceae bacterium]
MTSTAQQRRQPVQARSRETVARILAATDELIAAGGVEAATTRAIADRAGVSAPSLYRFYADRDEIFDSLLRTELATLEAHVEEAERRWVVKSTRDFVTRELDLHVSYYEEHPSMARLWFGGRISPAVVAEVHRRNQTLARRVRSTMLALGMIDERVPESALVLMVELGDRILDLAFRDRARADVTVIEQGCNALCAYVERLAAA